MRLDSIWEIHILQVAYLFWLWLDDQDDHPISNHISSSKASDADAVSGNTDEHNQNHSL